MTPPLTWPRAPPTQQRPACGEQTVVALCGEPDTLQTDPRLWSKYASKAKKKRQQERYEGFVVAEQLSDIEYTDVDTGLGWIDMDCVDCCRVSNNNQRKSDRERLDWFLRALALYPERVKDHRVREVMEYLEEVYDFTEDEGE